TMGLMAQEAAGGAASGGKSEGTVTGGRAIDLEMIGTWCNSKNLAFRRIDEEGRILIDDVGKLRLSVAFNVDKQNQVMNVLIAVPYEQEVEFEVLARIVNQLNLVIRSGSFLVRADKTMFFRSAVATKGVYADIDGI